MTRKIQPLGFLGAGNMAGALIRGLLKDGTYTPGEIRASDSDPEKTSLLAGETGIRPCGSNAELLRECAAVVLAVKPQVVDEVLKEVRDEVRDDHLIFTIAAGIPLRRISRGIGRTVPMVRVMPNTPALVGKGMCALAAGEKAVEDHMEIARGIFGSVGETITLREDLMDAVTALSGSGPGFVFRIMEAFVRAGREAGFSEKEAVKLVLAVFTGAGHLAAQSDKSLSELRTMVTSPGGTTEAGLRVMDGRGLENIILETVLGALARARELGREDA